MGWLITLAILIALGAIPLGISVHYDKNGFQAKAIAGFLHFTVFPIPRWLTKKEAKKQPEKNTSQPVKKQAAPKESTAQSGGNLRDFLPLVSDGILFLNSFRKKLRLNHFYMKLVLAEDDPCDLAVHYGWACGIMENIAAQLEKCFVIVKRDFQVGCDFLAEESKISAHLDITITLGRFLLLAIVYGYQIIVHFLSIKKKQKGGASV